jgi:hypothetical protein
VIRRFLAGLALTNSYVDPDELTGILNFLDGPILSRNDPSLKSRDVGVTNRAAIPIQISIGYPWWNRDTRRIPSALRKLLRRIPTSSVLRR